MDKFKTLSEAYAGVIKKVFEEGNEVSPRGQLTKEILSYQCEITEPSPEPIVTRNEKRNATLARYTKDELEWYQSGNINADTAPAKFWKTIAYPDGTINSNYGYLLFDDHSEGLKPDRARKKGVELKPLKTPFKHAYDALYNDKDTRQALLRFNKPEHLHDGNKDVVCTVYGNFLIRDNKLQLIVRMRSNDLFTGTPYDWTYFAYLQEEMLRVLKKTKYTDLEKGSLFFSADSMHMYEKNFETLRTL